MASTLDATVSLRIRGTQTNALDLSSTVDTLNQLWEQAFANGTGINQANKVWADTRSINSASNETLDLAGSLVDAFGTTLTFTKVKGIFIRSRSTNTTALTVSAASAPIVGLFGDDTADTLLIQPGDIWMRIIPSAAGLAVTATSADGLKIANASGAAATYDIVIIGCA